MTHIYLCVGKLTTIGSDGGFSAGRRQAIIWNNVKPRLHYTRRDATRRD